MSGWNYYVDATLAFLRHDKPAPLAAKARLTAIACPKCTPPLKDGRTEIQTQTRQQLMLMRWSPNIEVVDVMIVCFDKQYSGAYAVSYRPTSH
jgi:hypothetical protein